jgi:hypothetical protein
MDVVTNFIQVVGKIIVRMLNSFNSGLLLQPRLLTKKLGDEAQDAVTALEELVCPVEPHELAEQFTIVHRDMYDFMKRFLNFYQVRYDTFNGNDLQMDLDEWAQEAKEIFEQLEATNTKFLQLKYNFSSFLCPIIYNEYSSLDKEALLHVIVELKEEIRLGKNERDAFEEMLRNESQKAVAVADEQLLAATEVFDRSITTPQSYIVVNTASSVYRDLFLEISRKCKTLSSAQKKKRFSTLQSKKDSMMRDLERLKEDMNIIAMKYHIMRQIVEGVAEKKKADEAKEKMISDLDQQMEDLKLQQKLIRSGQLQHSSVNQGAAQGRPPKYASICPPGLYFTGKHLFIAPEEERADLTMGQKLLDAPKSSGLLLTAPGHNAESDDDYDDDDDEDYDDVE